MAYTTLALLLGDTKASNLLNPGDSRNIIVTGEVSADIAPGAWVFNDTATEKWIPLNNATAAHKLAGPGQVGVVLYRKRIYTSTGALRLNSDDYDITYTKQVPICISGIVGCDIADQGADYNIGTRLQAGDTAESADVQALEIAHSTHDSTQLGLVNNCIGTLAANYVDDDTKCIAGLGLCMGSYWGGINE